MNLQAGWFSLEKWFIHSLRSHSFKNIYFSRLDNNELLKKQGCYTNDDETRQRNRFVIEIDGTLDGPLILEFSCRRQRQLIQHKETGEPPRQRRWFTFCYIIRLAVLQECNISPINEPNWFHTWFVSSPSISHNIRKFNSLSFLINSQTNAVSFRHGSTTSGWTFFRVHVCCCCYFKMFIRKDKLVWRGGSKLLGLGGQFNEFALQCCCAARKMNRKNEL